MDQQKVSKWERARRRGLWRFVLVWTVALGATMTAVTTVFDYFVGGGRPILDNMKIRAPIFLMSAFLSGLAVWFVGQRRGRQSAEAVRIVERTSRVQRP